MRETRIILSVAQLSMNVKSIMETEYLPRAALQVSVGDKLSGERDKRILRVARLSMKENKTEMDEMRLSLANEKIEVNKSAEIEP